MDMKGMLSWCVLAYAAQALAGGAVLSPVADAEVATCANGVIVFDDRPYQMTPAAAERLAGKTFFRRTIDGGFAAEVVKGGELFVVTPTEKAGKSLSQGKTLAALGFEKLPGEPFLAFGVNKCDISDVWCKDMRPGEKLALGKWALVCGFDPAGQPQPDPAMKEKEDCILAYLKGTPSEIESPRDILKNKPDYVVFVPKQPRAKEKRDPAKPGDTYNDHFQVICNPSNQHLYAFWTQASREADIDQHIAFSKSVDKGVTWTPPVVLAGSPNKKNPALLASWQQPMLAKSGRLYCLWNQQTTSRGPHCGMMFGAFSDDDGETWSAPKLVPFTERMDADPADDHIPPSWCNWQRPLRLGENGKYFVGCSRHGKAPYDERHGCKIEFWQFENIDDNPPVQDIRITYLCTNRHALSAKDLENAGGFRASEPALEEAAPVKLPDGRLFAIMRSSLGSPVWVQSRDGGATWSEPKILRDAEGKPYLHPRSPCPMYDWKGPEAASGKYFALVHQTFDFNDPKRNAYQHRGPLYLIAGEFDPNGEQPVKFKAPKLFAPRKGGNSFYTSYCILDGKGVLWYNDMKFYLCGRVVGPEWFE
ncbi:MAG: exo-alpha-sialidase [Kiritimatiellae bacterium]|nr:exo-alpha-sialidase [Kiritimatiellia bacterium]